MVNVAFFSPFFVFLGGSKKALKMTKNRLKKASGDRGSPHKTPPDEHGSLSELKWSETTASQEGSTFTNAAGFLKTARAVACNFLSLVMLDARTLVLLSAH